MTQNELEHPAMIYRGGSHRPERCEPGYKLPPGTLVFSDRKQWQAACKGKSTYKVFAYTTKKSNLLYAILP